MGGRVESSYVNYPKHGGNSSKHGCAGCLHGQLISTLWRIRADAKQMQVDVS